MKTHKHCRLQHHPHRQKRRDLSGVSGYYHDLREQTRSHQTKRHNNNGDHDNVILGVQACRIILY